MRNSSLLTIRTLLLGIVLGSTTNVRSQFQLEHTYAGGSLINPYSNQLFLLELEANGWKYVRVDRENMEVALYNMDHTFWKSVSFTMVTPVGSFAASWDILYISEHLFDLDDGLEFMFTNYDPMGDPKAITQVVDEESGGLIFSVENQLPAVRSNYHQQQYPIRNTSEGTKLILASAAANNDSAYVYGLAGEFSTQMAQTWNDRATAGTPELFPNPAADELMVRMTTPEQGVMLEVINSDGQVVLDRSLNTTITTINIGGLMSGGYLCRFTGEGRSERVASFVKY